MPSCCIKGCGARKNINQPQLTLHVFPRNELMRRKWLDVIGIDNINPRHKDWYVCSLHFEQTCFNRTLTVTRLCDGAVPFCSLMPIEHRDQSSDEIIRPMQELPTEDQSYGEENINEPLQNALDHAHELIRQQTEKMSKLNNKCIKLQKQVKSLTEKVRRREKKIAVLSNSNIIKDVKDKNLINSHETILLEECAGTGHISGFVVRKISKCLTCDLCLSLLLEEEKTDSLIYQKSRGLVYASNDVLTIIKKTENLIKPPLRKSRPENYFIYIFKFLIENCSFEKYFYSVNQEHNINHRLLLVKAIIKTFIDLRFRHHARVDKISYRNYYNKLILFRNE